MSDKKIIWNKEPDDGPEESEESDKSGELFGIQKYQSPSLDFKSIPKTPSASDQLVLDKEDENQSKLAGNARLEEICQFMFQQDPGLLILHITEPLEGIMDFDFLGGKHAITEIQFAEQGRITHIRKLPLTLQKLTCTSNELSELTDLPASLLELYVSHNQLSTVDFSQTPQLRIFQGSYNHLYSMSHLPSTLEQLYVNNNQLSEIDLLGLDQLRTLHCLNNPHPLILKHVPEQTMDLQMDEGPLSHFESQEDDFDDFDESATPKSTKISYLDALNRYMEFKTKYETNAKRIRERTKLKQKSKTPSKSNKKPTLPPCIYCSANVGMTFKKKDKIYLAHCGLEHSKPNCSFRIELDSGIYEPFLDNLQKEMEEMNRAKQGLIRQKMDTLFGFMSETESASLFQERLKTYVYSNDLFDSILMPKYTSLYSNLVQKDLMERQWNKISELKSNMQSMLEEYQSEPLNRELLHDAMKLYVDQLLPEIKRLRTWKHPIMEMNDVTNHHGDVIESKLFQQNFVLENLLYEYEEPKVIHYSIGTYGSSKTSLK